MEKSNQRTFDPESQENEKILNCNIESVHYTSYSMAVPQMAYLCPTGGDDTREGGCTQRGLVH